MTPERANIKSFLSNMTIVQKMTELESQIRAQPDQFQYRWQLFLLLCLQGNWERALQQLQVCARIDAQFAQEAQALRWLIKCEHFRQQNVFLEGKQKPSFWTETETPWMQKMFEALQLNIAKQVDQADEKRSEALDMGPEVNGTVNGESFLWLTDSDSRLGPLCEVYHNQNYWWISFADIKQINFYKPQTVTDLIWAKAQFVLKDHSVFMAYVPARYPLGNEPKSDEMLLGQYTSWQEEGETLVIGQGQKMFAADREDYPILECQEIIFE